MKATGCVNEAWLSEPQCQSNCVMHSYLGGEAHRSPQWREVPGKAAQKHHHSKDFQSLCETCCQQRGTTKQFFAARCLRRKHVAYEEGVSTSNTKLGRVHPTCYRPPPPFSQRSKSSHPRTWACPSLGVPRHVGPWLLLHISGGMSDAMSGSIWWFAGVTKHVDPKP